jgi:vanillate O-demethylase monooxygenase subunit
MAFVKNVWYVAAWGWELEPDALFSRTLLDQPVLLYRTSDGGIAAMSDRCSHRFAPLHMGKRSGDNVVCPYHGLTYDMTGRCVRSGHGDGTIPPQARQAQYRAVERDGLIWIWMGDLDRADPALIPDYSYLTEGSDDGVFTGYLHTRGNYLLMNDNILDLSHADFLHPGFLGTGDAVTAQRPKVQDNERGFRVSWDFDNSATMAVFAMAMQSEERTDGWLWVDWEPVSSMKLHSGVTRCGEPREAGISLTSIHCMTPETERSTHYFYGTRRDFMVDAKTNELMAQITRKTFSTEDTPIVEAVQRYMGDSDLWSLKPAILSSDVAGVRMRRGIEKLVRMEQGQSRSEVSAETTV